MILATSVHFPFKSSPTSFRVWAGSRLAALAIGLCLVWALSLLEPLQSPIDPPAITGVILAPLEPVEDRPKIIPPPPEPILKHQDQAKLAPTKSPEAAVLKSPASPITDRPTPQVVPRSSNSAPQAVTGAPVNQSPPRIATAPSSAKSPSSSSGSATAPSTPAPRLGASTMTLLRARECARLDIRDRPADCPPNDELKRLLAIERGPQYRPENAEAFSRNEQLWRGVPPPCLKDGENFKVSGTGACVRIGTPPSRVRTVREICEARGLGGCADAPSQAAVNAAVELVRRQEAAKAVKP
jgi:hypothetical protein